MRRTATRTAQKRALLVSGVLLAAMGLGTGPSATAAVVANPLVPADEGGIYRSTIAPMVPPGCGIVAVDLPLVDGVTWWVQVQDMIWAAEPGQQLDPTGTTVLTAVLRPGWVFEDGTTSARWVVAPVGGDVTTGCTGEPVPAPVEAVPPAAPPTPAAPAPSSPAVPAVPAPPAVPTAAAAPAAPATAAVPPAPAAPAATPTAGRPTRPGAPARAAAPAAAVVEADRAVAPATSADSELPPAAGAVLAEPVGATVADESGVTEPVGQARPGHARAAAVQTARHTDRSATSSEPAVAGTEVVRTVAVAPTSATTPADGSTALAAGLLLALAASGAATAAARRGRAPAQDPARG